MLKSFQSFVKIVVGSPLVKKNFLIIFDYKLVENKNNHVVLWQSRVIVPTQAPHLLTTNEKETL